MEKRHESSLAFGMWKEKYFLDNAKQQPGSCYNTELH